MRIAILSPFYPYRGGIAQFSDRLYQELIKEHDVKVFSYSKLYPKLLFPGKTQFVPNPVLNPNLPSERILNSTGYFSYKKTATAINNYNPDILIIAYWTPYIAIALSSVCSRLNKKIKTLGLVHNAIPHEKSLLNRLLSMRFFKRCNAFVCMSANVENDLRKLQLTTPILTLEHPIYDHYPEKIEKALACKELGLDGKKKTILFFGLIRAYKGLDLLIGAMGKLDDSYQLVIAGESYGGFESYQQLIDISKNSDNIKVWDQYISDDMVSTFFSVADVLVLPYRSATQSGVIAVAYQMGTPMIVTNVGSLGKTVGKAKVGLVVSDVSAESIVTGIEDFFSMDYKSLYASNLENEKTRLSWSSFTKSIELFVSDI